MERYELERDFLNQKLKEVHKELQSKLKYFESEYPPAKSAPEGAKDQIHHHQVENDIVAKLLSEKSDVALEERLLKRIQKRWQDEIEYIKESRVETNGYSGRFWSDELYIELLEKLLRDWMAFKTERYQ